MVTQRPAAAATRASSGPSALSSRTRARRKRRAEVRPCRAVSSSERCSSSIRVMRMRCLVLAGGRAGMTSQSPQGFRYSSPWRSTRGNTREVRPDDTAVGTTDRSQKRAMSPVEWRSTRVVHMDESRATGFTADVDRLIGRRRNGIRNERSPCARGNTHTGQTRMDAIEGGRPVGSNVRRRCHVASISLRTCPARNHSAAILSGPPSTHSCGPGATQPLRTQVSSGHLSRDRRCDWVPRHAGERSNVLER